MTHHHLRMSENVNNWMACMPQRGGTVSQFHVLLGYGEKIVVAQVMIKKYKKHMFLWLHKLQEAVDFAQKYINYKVDRNFDLGL